MKVSYLISPLVARVTRVFFCLSFLGFVLLSYMITKERE